MKYFCDAARTENFSKTASKYGVPASNISQSISRLEKEVGVKLFGRSANQISLNEKGKAFFTRIEKALNYIEEAKTVISDDSVSGKIRIKICTNRRIITETIERFRKKYPDVAFNVSHNHNSDGTFDLIVSDDVLKYRNFDKELLIRENIVMAAKQGSAALNKKISELDSERFITMHDGSSQYRLTKEICEDAGFVPDIAIQSDDPYYIRKYVSMGLGISFVPEISWKGQFEKNVECNNVAGITRDTFVFWDGKRYMTKAVEEFLNMLLNNCKEYIRQ